MHDDELLSRSILDPIHGLIRLSDSEVAVIDHRLFQRLRNIKQNGLLCLVFPAATHTRFEHSLGALFVANTMLDNLYLNSTVGRVKGTVRNVREAGPGEAIDLVENDSVSWLRRVTRMSALVHDLGHGPLSHTFDGFAPTRKQLSNVLSDTRLVAIAPLREALEHWGAEEATDPRELESSRVPHEVMSCVLFAYLWHDLHNGEETWMAQYVAAAILGSDAISLIPDAEAKQWLPLVHDMIASAPADADRMDYLERDSRSVGVTYGLFDRNRVMKTLLCYRDERTGPAQYRLGMKASGLAAIENLMQARFELFIQIYYHKTNRAVSCMLKSIADDARRTGLTLFQTADLPEWVSTYLSLSDDSFVTYLKGGHSQYQPPSAHVRSLATAIDERKVWKRIYDYRHLSRAQRIAKTLRRHAPSARIIVDRVPPKATKDLKGGARLLERNSVGVYAVEPKRKWFDAPIIRALQDTEKSFVRIYLAEHNSQLAKDLRDRARKLELNEGI